MPKEMTSIELRLTGSHLIKEVSSSMRYVIRITTPRTKSVPKQKVKHLVIRGESTSMTIVYENGFQNKSIDMIFTFVNSIT
jgi:hypothetical protein